MRNKKLIVSLVLIASFIFSFVPVEVFANTSLDAPTNIQFYPRATWIGLNWDTVSGAAGYDVEVDGIIYDSNWSYFYIGSFQTGVTHTFTVRVRAKNADATILSPWSDPVEVYNLDSLAVPANVKYTATDTSITFTWDSVEGADYYEVELDGVVQGNWVHRDDRAYTIKDLDPNKKHSYSFRVRGLEETPYYSPWSESITASTTGPVERWEAATTMPTVRGGVGAAAFNGKIYVTGGATSSSYLTLVEEYDPDTNKWVKKADMLLGRAVHEAIALNGKIYAYGGAITYVTLDNGKLHEYDPIANKWAGTLDTSAKRYYQGITSLNGKMYIIGGLPLFSSCTGYETEEFDPITNSLTRKADVPTKRYAFKAAAANGKIYAIGGRDTSKLLNIVEEYDPTTDTWSPKSPMPTPRSNISVATVGDKIYVIGGHDGRSPSSIVEVYDPATDKWSTGPKLPYSISGTGTAVIDNKIYVFGDGSYTSANANKVLVLTANPDKH